MAIPLKLAWAISALKHQVSELHTSNDGIARDERLSMANKCIEDIEQQVAYMDGQPMPDRRDGPNTVFKVFFRDECSHTFWKKKYMRDFLEGKNPKMQWRSTDITRIMQSQFSWQQASLEELKQYAYNQTTEE